MLPVQYKNKFQRMYSQKPEKEISSQPVKKNKELTTHEIIKIYVN